jgi:aldehyde:ferredoxin oxidoreductase
MGADHTAGLIVNPGMPQEEWAQASQQIQLINVVCDSSGFCQFLQPTLDDIRAFYGELYGEEISREQIADQGWQGLQDEWEFNKRAGLTSADDEMPECMAKDAIGPQGIVWDVDAAVVAQAYTRFDNNDQLFETKAAG